MNYTLMFLLVALIYIFMAIHTLSKDPLDIRNRLYFAISMLFAFWGLLNGTLFLITEPEIAANARKYLVFSWGVVYSLILHLVLVLSGYNRKVNKNLLYGLLYIPAVINIILYFFKPVAGKDLVLTDKGWLISNFFEGGFIWNNYFYVYYISFTLLTIFFVIKWKKNTRKKREKKQSQIMLGTVLLAFILGSVFEIILPLQGKLIIYGVTIIIALIPIAGIWYAIERYGLMNFKPDSIAIDVLQMMNEGLIICGVDGSITSLNEGVKMILGYTKEDQNLNIYELFHGEVDLLQYSKASEIEMIDKFGHRKQVLLNALPLKDCVLESYGFLVIFQDISSLTNMQKRLISMNEALEDTVNERTNELLTLNEELIQEIKEKELAEKKIKHLAYYDQLTDLPNLRCFIDEMNKRILECGKQNKKIAVLFIDLDGFKTINDTKGHTKGDELLKIVAKRFENHIKDGDLVARTGGDEFYCIINLNRQKNYINTVMDVILNLFKEPFVSDGSKMYITCSIGAAIFPDHGLTTNELVKHGDIAMYEAKALGKNRAEIFTPEMLHKITNEERIKEDLRKAIDNNEFEMYYQPLVDSLSNKLIGTEALIRWNHPKLGLISPIKFIAIAEKNGFIEAIGTWVIEEGMRQHKKWKETLGVCIPMSINLSVNQLRKKDIVIDILKLKKKFDVDLSYFEFEVTESIFIDEKSYALRTLKRISEIGARIAIDDFGIAYSSLAYIKKLPINKIKIDKVFVDGIGKDERDEAIIKTIVSLCDQLNMDIVAEGVEQLEQVEFLREANCHRIQGYYYSKPLQAEAFEAYYRNINKSVATIL